MPFLSPDEQDAVRIYARDRPGVNPEDIIRYERFRRESSYKASTNLQQQMIDAEEQGNFQQQLDLLDQRQAQVRAINSPEVTDDVREQIRQYAQQHGGNADAMLEWEQHRRDALPQNVEAREQQAAIRRATRKKIATGAALGVGGVALVGGGLYLGSKYGNFSLNPVDWFHHK